MAVFSNCASKKAAPEPIAELNEEWKAQATGQHETWGRPAAEPKHTGTNSIGSWLKATTLFTAICGAGGLLPNSMNTTVASDTPDKQMMLAEHNPNLTGFQVVEFRRYLVKPEERQHFAQYFEAYFPEAFSTIRGHRSRLFFRAKKSVGVHVDQGVPYDR